MEHQLKHLRCFWKWKTAFRGIISDEFLNSLTYEKATQKNKSRFDKGLWCVCEIENRIVGYSWFSTERFDVDEEPFEYDSELIAIYVRPELKGKGIGKELFTFVTAKLKSKGRNKMILWVLEDNLPAIEFYKKMGGKLLGRKEKEIGGRLYNEISFGYDL